MGLIKKIAEIEKKRGFLFYGFFTSISVIALFIVLSKIVSELQPFSKKLVYKNINPDWIWYVLWIGSIVAILCIWVYYAPIVCNKFSRLENAFSDTQYCHLYSSFQKWIYFFSHPHFSRLLLFKFTYLLFWALFFGEFFYFSWQTLKILYTNMCLVRYAYILLIIFSTSFNFFSYYICIIYVYFLIKITKSEHDSPLEYIESCPSLTYGIQTLINVSSTINIYFLLDSFLCTTAYFSYWNILLKNKQVLDKLNGYLFIAFIYVSVFMVMFGLLSWIFIVFLSRIYIVRLHDLWKERSLVKLNEKYQTSSDQREQAAIENKLKDLFHDRISIGWLELSISFTTLAANIFTALTVFLSGN